MGKLMNYFGVATLMATSASIMGCQPKVYGPAEMTEGEINILASLVTESMDQGFLFNANSAMDEWKRFVERKEFKWHKVAQGRSFKDGWGNPLRLICIKHAEKIEISIYSNGKNERFDDFGGDDLFEKIIYVDGREIARKVSSRARQ